MKKTLKKLTRHHLKLIAGEGLICTNNASCVPEEQCIRKYGDNPLDILNYGISGPCLGLGSVRCLDSVEVHCLTDIFL